MRTPRTRTAALTATTLALAATALVTVDAGPALAAPARDATVAASPGPLLRACPIDGDSEFTDSWGAPRSGGRRHEGVDMIAPHGTPIVAVRDGEVEFKRSGLGGRAVWLSTDDGDRFYYAHLADWAGESRSVQAGELIGWVGSTGNARGPHLHFEAHPGGRVDNPYPAVADACLPPIAIHWGNAWLCDPAIRNSPFADDAVSSALADSCPTPPRDPGTGLAAATSAR